MQRKNSENNQKDIKNNRNISKIKTCKYENMNKKMAIKKVIKKTIKEYILITIGCIFMATGISLFLLPNELSTGGFAGISTILYYLAKLPVGTTMLVLNIPLLLIAYFKIGKELFIKSIYGTVILSLSIDILDKLPQLTQDRFLACIYGGILVGIGTAIILKNKASTGGSDLLSYVIRAYKPQYRTSTLILSIDTVIITLNVIFFKTIEIGLYSAIAIYLMGKMIDIIFEGVNFTKILFIISPKYKEIAEKIGENINRGSTALYSQGMYTNQDKMTLLCVGSRTETYAIEKIVKKIDKTAFIIVLNAREVLGKGFK